MYRIQLTVMRKKAEVATLHLNCCLESPPSYTQAYRPLTPSQFKTYDPVIIICVYVYMWHMWFR